MASEKSGGCTSMTHLVSKATKLRQAGQGHGWHDCAVSCPVGQQRLLRSNHGFRGAWWKSHFWKMGTDARQWTVSRDKGTWPIHPARSWAALVPDEKTRTSQQALKTWEEKQAGDGGVLGGKPKWRVYAFKTHQTYQSLPAHWQCTRMPDASISTICCHALKFLRMWWG